MRNKDYRFSRLKKQLSIKRANKTKYVIWSLTNAQVEFVKNLGYNVEPYIHSIKTKKFSHDLRQQYSILRDLHFAYVKGKPAINTKLKFQDIQVLDEFNIRHYPIKYRINLI